MGITFAMEYFNGALGIVVRVGGVPISALAVTQSLQLIANPEKLAFLRAPAVGLR